MLEALRTAVIAAQATAQGTHWYAFDAPPRLLFEQVILHLRRFVPGHEAFVGAEWWFRATSTDTGCPFHFDRDERVRSSIVSPGIASILYLSNAGGPTVILDATPARSTAPRAGIAVDPRVGRFVMFPGALLHGVLPSPPSRWPRVTLLVNWWPAVPRLERAPALASTLASDRWRPDDARRPAAPLAPFDPARLLGKAAWRDIIANQVSYR